MVGRLHLILSILLLFLSQLGWSGLGQKFFKFHVDILFAFLYVSVTFTIFIVKSKDICVLRWIRTPNYFDQVQINTNVKSYVLCKSDHDSVDENKLKAMIWYEIKELHLRLYLFLYV